MVYLTFSRLLRESVASIRHHAAFGEELILRACVQLTRDATQYRDWRAVHNELMRRVARCAKREPQIRELRLIATELIARAARVRFLRQQHLCGDQRAALLGAAWPGMDIADAAIAEHQRYVRATVSELCASELLALCNDQRGLLLLADFERAYQKLVAERCSWLLLPIEACGDQSAQRLQLAARTVAGYREQLLDGTGMPPLRNLSPVPGQQRLITGERLPLPRVLTSGVYSALPVADHPFDRDVRVTVR